MMSRLQDISIRYLKGIGPKRAKIFSQAGINNVEELLYRFPKRYEDRTKFSPICAVQEGEAQTIKARILSRRARAALYRRSFSIIEVIAGDSTGRLNCVWFNQPYLKEYFKPGTTLILYGKVERRGKQLQMNSPEFEIVEEEGLSDTKGAVSSLNIGRIVPIYSLPERVSQRHFRQLMHFALDEYLPRVTDCLSFELRKRNSLLNIAASLRLIHFPENLQAQKEAYRRLAFEEFFLFQVPVALRKLSRKEKPGIAHKIELGLAGEFIARLPFQLTPAQSKVLAEIKEDMAKPFAMQRLLQGDVGSGKTVIATIASLIAVQGGYQAAFMVPTEILAGQHCEKIKGQLSIVNSQWPIKIGLLTSSANKKEKDKIYQEIKEGSIDLIIGTHALLEENVRFKNLGLVVIDEQHKFGVGQRALLPAKGANPDVLIMTATPIPRTLAITLYADLDISVINELPAGRKPIHTERIEEKKRDWLYGFMRKQIACGRQAYIVYPVIEESAALDLSGAKKMYAQLKKDVFGSLHMGLLHGRLKQEEQDRVMAEFRRGKIQILVATTVLEVGIDVANATLMVVEHAQRFGLSQLHQLRGRIGRGKEESFCFLLSGAAGDEAAARLEAMVKYSDGFYIAEEDLRIRGPGEFFGRRQHGLSELKIANPLTQMQLLKIAREEAVRLVAQDARLENRLNAPLKEKLLQRFPEYEKLVMVG